MGPARIPSRQSWSSRDRRSATACVGSVVGRREECIVAGKPKSYGKPLVGVAGSAAIKLRVQIFQSDACCCHQPSTTVKRPSANVSSTPTNQPTACKLTQQGRQLATSHSLPDSSTAVGCRRR